MKPLGYLHYGATHIPGNGIKCDRDVQLGNQILQLVLPTLPAGSTKCHPIWLTIRDGKKTPDYELNANPPCRYTCVKYIKKEMVTMAFLYPSIPNEWILFSELKGMVEKCFPGGDHHMLGPQTT